MQEHPLQFGVWRLLVYLQNKFFWECALGVLAG